MEAFLYDYRCVRIIIPNRDKKCRITSHTALRDDQKLPLIILPLEQLYSKRYDRDFAYYLHLRKTFESR